MGLSRTPEARAAYYLENKEKYKEAARARYIKNKEELLEYQRVYRKENKERISKRNTAKRQQRLLDAIVLLGGKCQMCDGVFDPCVYDFHHINPSTKEFTIGENMLVSEERFFNEVLKCELLCANCHR